MPEMPEVESLARWLTQRTAGLEIAKVDVLAISALKTFSPPVDALVGCAVNSWSRRGKFLLLHAGDLFCCIHLARAGWLRWQDELTTATAKLSKGPQALRVRFTDGSGFTATEAGHEKRLQVHVVANPNDVEQIRTLGIDPFDPAFTAARLGEILAAHGRAQIKGVLTEQGVIAGVGNAYSDEALNVAKLSPFKPANSLATAEVDVLRDAIVGVLGDAIERSAGKPASELKDAKRSGMRVHGRAGQPCPACGDTVREVSFASKSLQYCATCQTGGKPLADRRLSRLLK
jgi:formamidopyrimidine-DNA glycosylase